MRKSLLAATAILMTSPAWAQNPPPPMTDAERAQAVQELHEMRGRIPALESRLGVSPPPPMQYTPAAPRPPKDHNLELYGFLERQSIQDFKLENQTRHATVVPSRVPTEKGEFGGNGQSIFSVRQ